MRPAASEVEISPWEPADRLLTADEARLDAIAYAFAGVIDAKSPWTYRHSDRACVIVLGLAAALGAEDDELDGLRRAALLHDVGKLAVSNRILDKPGALTAAELAQIRKHPGITRQILERVPGFGALAPIAAAHHERLDGTGYPQRLTTDELTMPMRLLAVADVYEALTSERPYRAAMRSEQALEIIREEAPHALDHEAASALASLVHDPGTPAGLGPVGHPEEDAARVEEVLDRPRAPVAGDDG
jgi:HD-GYP domain-containing protein (c-di-GMP phosphodiesterase class II)